MPLQERAERKRNKDLEKVRQMHGDLSVVPPLDEYVKMLEAVNPTAADASGTDLAGDAGTKITDGVLRVEVAIPTVPTPGEIDEMVAKVGIARRKWVENDPNRPEFAIYNQFEDNWQEPDAVFKARLASSTYFDGQRSATPQDLVEPRAAHGAEMLKYKPVGKFSDFLDGYASACPNGASLCEYFGVEGDPGAYYAYVEQGRQIGRWDYFPPGATPQVVRSMGERAGRWVQDALSKEFVAARDAGKVLA